MPHRRLVLSCRKYATELSHKADQGFISRALADAWERAIDIAIVQADYSVRDLPVLTREIVDSIRLQTDEGKFTYRSVAYQLVPLLSNYSRCEPRLTVLRINDSSYGVQSWNLLDSDGSPALLALTH